MKTTVHSGQVISHIDDYDSVYFPNLKIISIMFFYNFLDGIPRDSSFILTIVSVKALSATVVLYFMASLGILFTFVCLIFNIIFRKRKYTILMFFFLYNIK